MAAYISDSKPQHTQHKPSDKPSALQALNDLRRLVRHHSQFLLPAMHAMVIAALPAIDALRSITAKFAMALFQVRRWATVGLAGLRCRGLLVRGASSPLQELCQAVGQSEVPCCPTQLVSCSSSSPAFCRSCFRPHRAGRNPHNRSP